MTKFWYFICAFVVAMLAVKLMQPLAHRFGLIDKPNHRKLHVLPVALVGGIAVFCGIIFAAFFLHINLDKFHTLLFGSAVLLVLGVVDDFFGISPYLRLLVQLLLALLLVYHGHLMISNVGELLNKTIDIQFGKFVAPVITLIAVMAMINAMNMLDGQDGLLGGVAAIQLAWMAFLSYKLGNWIAGDVLLIIIGGICGFLVFNLRWPWMKQAYVFMGDAGSTMLGFVTAWFAIYLSQSPVSIQHVGPITFLWIVALPALDISSVVLRRVLAGKSPLSPDRGHVHHMLHDFGLGWFAFCRCSWVG